MKKEVTLRIAGAALLASTYVSCNEQLEVIAMTSGEALAQEKFAQFDQAFIDHFGQPAPNHQWGQDLPLLPMYLDGGAATRAGASTDNVDTNKNKWVQRIPAQKKYDSSQNPLIQKVQVPGWPNFDGYYYGEVYQGSKWVHEPFDEDAMWTNESNPIGDVTDYEIQYVSTWFRTHRYPKSIDLHLTDFFIQNISCDNDQLAYTNAVDDSGKAFSDPATLGGMGTTPGKNGANANLVNDILTGSGIPGIKKDGVIATVKRITNPDNNEDLNYKMDYLHFGAVGASFDKLKSGDGTGWTHINNFNNESTNANPEESSSTDERVIMYVHSSGTEDFACRASQGTIVDGIQPWIHDWVLVRLTWQEEGADGQMHQREGYYLGFDFSEKTGQIEIERDGFYSNWILKISPAYFQAPTSYAKRVMCEDLGGSFDFDFNDVVFDVAFDGSKNEAIISLQAAGGTLPIYVGDKISGATDNEFQEAHHLLGNAVSQPVNVSAGASHEVAIYRVPVSATVKNNLAFISIPITVKQGDNTITQEVVLGGTDAFASYEWDGNKYNVKKDMTTPRKFVTEVGVRWMKELKGIDKSYTQFKDWVTAPTTNTTWYDAYTNDDLLQ